MVAVSVVVVTRDPGRDLPGFVRSIDGQTLPAAEFELVVVDGSGDGSADRLRQLAGRRTNVTVLTAEAEEPESGRFALALARTSGEFVLAVRQEQRLTPRALELLLEHARRTGADLVLGRVVTAAASGSMMLPDDTDRLDASAVPVRCVALVRRSLVTGLPDHGESLTDALALAVGAATVSGLGRYACALEDVEARPPGAELSLASPVYRWADGVLHLTVEARLPAPVPGDLRAWLVVADDLAEVALPATVAVDERGPGAHVVSAMLDPRVAGGGGPIEDGIRDLRLRITAGGREFTLPLAGGPRRRAVIAGRAVVVRTAERTLRLDVGAAAVGVVARVPESQGSVSETVHGTLVTLHQPDLHVHGDAVLPARLLLDGFRLPARLVCQDGRARVEAYVGALAGVRAVSVLVGSGKPVRTGLRLRVDGAGRMVLEPLPPPQRPTAPGVPLAQRLRRRIPGGLDPIVRRLSRVPILRRAYRRAINR